MQRVLKIKMAPQRSLISRVKHVLSMLLNFSLATRFGPSLRSAPNLLVLEKSLPTYTYSGLKWVKKKISSLS